MRRLSGPPITRPDKGWPEKNGVWGSIAAHSRGGRARLAGAAHPGGASGAGAD